MAAITNVVWWDINTCPIPEGYDPAHVRPSIEWMLRKFSPLEDPLTIFCVGNLELVSPQVLESISSSGILIRHAPLGGKDNMYHLLLEWNEHSPPYMTDIMLISGDPSFKNDAILSLGYTILRAVPDPRPKPFKTYKPYKDGEAAYYTILEGVLWERLLKGNNARLMDTNNHGNKNSRLMKKKNHILKEEHVWFCTLCEVPSQSCDDFVNHLKSTEHKKEYMDSVFVNNNHVLFCKLCQHPGSGGDHNMTIHHNSEEHAHNVSSLAIRRFERFHWAEGFHVDTMTGVWWDINTCPIPDGFDPRCVRTSIESALNKYQGPDRPVTIFCVGNLEYISPQVLNDISSSGIFLRQTQYGGSSVKDHLSFEWQEFYPPPANIMLISCDSSWFNPFSHIGYVILRAFPNPRPPFEDVSYPSAKEWVWESLLKENLGPVETNSHILEEKCIEMETDACYCKICDIPSESCDDFIDHLKSTEHRDKLWGNAYKNIYCELCQYPAYDFHNMTIHLTSEEHAQNVLEYDLAHELEEVSIN